MAAVTRPKVDSVLPSELVEAALAGRIRIPSFQRSYRWERNDVTELFDSILRGYPIGNLLVWQRPAPSGIVTIGHLRIDAPALGDAYWIVDGQQRITSLVGALTASPETVDPRFRIYFDLNRAEFVSLARLQQPGNNLLPMALVLSTAEANAWIRARPHLNETQIALADQVVAAIRDYRIPMYIVSGDDDRALRDIFDRMNTFGKPLKSAEVFNALHSLSGEQVPSDLHTLGDSVRTFGFGRLSEQVLMQSLLALRGPKVDRNFRNEFKSNGDRHEAFVSTEVALGHVVDFLRDVARIPHIKLVPYSLFIPVLARFTGMFGPPDGRAAELLRRWIWRGAVLGVAPQGNTVGIRQGASAIHTDPVASADRLLALLPTRDRVWRPDLSQTRLNRAQAKVNVLGLLSRQPRYFSSEEGESAGVIDPARLLEEGRVLHPIVDLDGPLGAGMANRIVYPADRAGDLNLVLLNADIDESVLVSHCIDREALDLLRRGRPAAFAERREAIVMEVITDHVQSRALFGFRDGPDVTRLFDEDDRID